MTVLIKGIEMPPDIEGAEVIIHIKPDGTVFDMRGVHLQAQAVEVPTPHGRLIDADELMKVVYSELSYGEEALWAMIFCDGFIGPAPTVIEAEEEQTDVR